MVERTGYLQKCPRLRGTPGFIFSILGDPGLENFRCAFSPARLTATGSPRMYLLLPRLVTSDSGANGLTDDIDRNRAETQNQWFFIGIIGKKTALSVGFLTRFC